MRYFFKLLTVIISLLPLLVSAAPVPVKILSWWGYIDEKETINSIETSCNAKLMVDEYYTNSEFIRRHDDTEYDILIYSETAGGLLNRSLENERVDISYLSKNYHPVILNRYVNEDRKSNTAFFAIAGTVFVWDPSSLDFHKISKLTNLINASSGGPVVLLDDPIEVYTLLELGLTEEEKKSLNGTSDNFYGLGKFFKSSDVKVSNNLISSGTGFPFIISHFWSGGAVQFYKRVHQNNIAIKNEDGSSGKVKIEKVGIKGYPASRTKPRDYQYDFHKRFTHISKDLITLLTTSEAAKCVSDQLGQGPNHRQILNSTYYLSPSLILPERADEYYLEMHDKFFEVFPSMKWKKEITFVKYNELNALWQKIRIGL